MFQTESSHALREIVDHTGHLVTVGPRFTTAERVSFSHCGNSLEIIYTGRPWPTLLDLSPMSRFSYSRKHLLTHETTDTSRKKGKGTKTRDMSVKGSDIVLSHAAANLPAGNTIASSDSARDNTFVSLAEHNGREISIMHTNGSEEHIVPVLKLPQDTPVHSTSTMISIPSRSSTSRRDDGSDRCKIIVATNQPSRFISDEPAALPFVVRKDMRSLQIPASMLRRLEEPETTAAHEPRGSIKGPDESVT